MKILIGFGMYFAFRGCTEHSNLKVCQVYQGKFEEGHEFAGLPFVGVKDMQDKTHKLSVHRSYVRDTSTFMRMPVGDVDDKKSNNFGSSLVRYLKKLAPGQEFLYCHVMKPDRRRSFSRLGLHNVRYEPNRKLGKTPVAGLFKRAADIMGFSEPQKFHPHSLRSVFISKLVNDGSVSLAETMDSARHSSVAASATYQERSKVSEANKIRSLMEFEGPPKKRLKSSDDVKKKCDYKPPPQKNDDDDDFVVISCKPTPTPPPIVETKEAENFEYFSQPGATQIELDELKQEMEEVEDEFKSVTSSVTGSSSLGENSSLFQRDFASAEERLNQLKKTSFNCGIMPPPAQRPPSERQLRVQQLRRELAATRQQLRRIKEAKDQELLYRDSMEDYHEQELLRLRAQIRRNDAEKREMRRALEDAGLLYTASKFA